MSCSKNNYRDAWPRKGSIMTSNYRPYSQDPPILTDTKMISPQHCEIENCSIHSSSTVQTNFSTCEEQIRSLQGKADLMWSIQKSQTAWPYYTKYLEGKITTIQEDHQNIVTENITLNNQLSKISIRNRELEMKIAKLEETFQKDKQKCEPLVTKTQNTTHHRGVNTLVSGSSSFLEVSTSMKIPTMHDNTAQTTEQHQPYTENSDIDVHLVTIARTEFDDIVRNMKILRNAIKTKEDTWSQMVEREQNYREHLAQLSIELITAHQISDSRYNELQTVVQKLTQTKEDLRITEKELILAKKNIQKLQKLQRNSESHNTQGSTITTTNDNIESREKLLLKPDSHVQNSVTKQKAKLTSAKDIRGTKEYPSRDYISCSAGIQESKPMEQTKEFENLIKTP